MKALQTQFDNKRLSNAVATPTCSSCCCCCCCLATSIAASSLLAQRINKEGKKHQVFNRHLLTVLAALFLPITGALVYFGSWTLNLVFSNCTESQYSLSGSYANESYKVCTNPGAALTVPLLIIAPLLVLCYLYARVHIEKPLKRAALVTILIAVAFFAELIAGASLILTGVGGIVYLIMVPVVIGWISVWYRRHIGKEVSNDSITVPIQPMHPVPATQVFTMEQNDQEPPNTEEPTQQNPPTTSTQ